MAAEDLEKSLGSLHPLARQLSDALEGAVFPLTRRELVLVARENEAPPMLLTLIGGLRREGPYASLAVVQEAVDEREPATLAAEASGVISPAVSPADTAGG